MYIHRSLETQIRERLFSGKAIILYGPRQVGKSTLLSFIRQQVAESVLVLNCDSLDVHRLLSEPNVEELRRWVGKHKIVLIDEAQRIVNIGLTLKLFTDQLPDVQLLVTGSSALELANRVNEPLTGRKFEYRLFPLSVKELVDHFGFMETQRNLGNMLIYGTFPDVIKHPGDEIEILNNLTGSYLYKDVFIYQDIRKPELLSKLLEALALQVASEVSFHELSKLLRVDFQTIERYVTLLERAFILFRLTAFSRNVRNELKKSRKFYFYDNGIRNAILRNYAPLESRSDAGALFENFWIAERMKYLQSHRIHARSFFWRTTQQQEIDYLEEVDGVLSAWEIKWSPLKSGKIPLTFTRNYPDALTYNIHSENFWSHLGV